MACDRWQVMAIMIGYDDWQPGDVQHATPALVRPDRAAHRSYWPVAGPNCLTRSSKTARPSRLPCPLPYFTFQCPQGAGQNLPTRQVQAL
jgi:hypothetical protein